MSLKFGKNREVSYKYTMIPLKYTGIKHPKNADKELVLIDNLGKHYVAAYRSDKTNRVGITFLLKTTEDGFIYKDKRYRHKDSGIGWTW